VARQPTPHWQAIAKLPLIASMIDGMLSSAEEQHQTLQKARPRPHVLDDYTVGRVVEVFTTQQSDLWLFEEQLGRGDAHGWAAAGGRALNRPTGAAARGDRQHPHTGR
jgi:hypothetical protein